jgi:hypothetical protein
MHGATEGTAVDPLDGGHCRPCILLYAQATSPLTEEQTAVARRWRVLMTSMRWIARRVHRHKAVAHDRDQG